MGNDPTTGLGEGTGRRRALLAATMLVPYAATTLVPTGAAYAQAGVSYAPTGAQAAGAVPVWPSAGQPGLPAATPAAGQSAPAMPAPAPGPAPQAPALGTLPVASTPNIATTGGPTALTVGNGNVVAHPQINTSGCGSTLNEFGGQPGGLTADTMPKQRGELPKSVDVPMGVHVDPIKELLRQANYWHTLYQDDRALDALNRILTIDPNQPDALELAGEIYADRGDRTHAEALLARLRAHDPNDPRIAELEGAIKFGMINPAALAEARRLAAACQNDAAVQRYRALFQGDTPPPRLAVEYYQVLAGATDGWQPAKDGLSAVVRANPDNLRAQLALAQVLTYHEETRVDGIVRLARLAQNPAIGQAAVTPWRQGLLWLPAAASSVPLLQAYLAKFPNDVGIQQALAQARNPAQTGNYADNARTLGFKALNSGRLAEASREFELALKANPNDSDALGGLGLVRQRQGRYEEARTLLRQAIAADPARRGHWQSALNGGGNAGRLYAQVRMLAERGDYAAAEATLRRASGGRGNPGMELLIADIENRRGDTAAAMGSYRAVLARQPRNADALIGLAGILQQQGQTAEAQTLLAQAAATGSKNAARARGQQLRLQAAAQSDPAMRLSLYREAVAADPSDPWLRLDLARTLAAQGQVAAGEQVMAAITSGRRVGTDALRAGIIYANEASLPAEADALINRLPPGERSAQMQQTLAETRFKREIAYAQSLPPYQAQQRLLALAAGPDRTGDRGAEVARALIRMGDPQAARTAIATAAATGGVQSASARVAYAGALMDAGYSQDAQAMLANLGNAPLTPGERRAVVSMRDGLAIRRADQLNREGRQAAAYDQLAPALAQNPANPALNLSLARLYQGADRPGKALSISEQVLRRDPDNEQARKGAVDAALADHDFAAADRLVREGLRQHPNDPQAWMTSADLAQARGDNGRAIRDLQRARDLRLQQVGGTSAGYTVPAYGSDGGSDRGDDGAPASYPGNGPGLGIDNGTTMTLSPDGPPILSAPVGAGYPVSPPTSLALPEAAPPMPTINPYRSFGAPRAVAQAPLASPAAYPAPYGYAPPAYAPSGYVPPGYVPSGYVPVLPPPGYPPAYPPYYPAPGYPPPGYPAPYYPTATNPMAGYPVQSYQAPGYTPAPRSARRSYAQAAPAYTAPAYPPAPAYQPPAYQAPGYQAPANPFSSYRPLPAPDYAQAPPTAAFPARSYEAPAYQGQGTYPTPVANSVPAAGPAPSVYNNPFSNNASVPGTFGASNGMLAEQDPMTAQIDRSLAMLRAEVAPAVEGGVEFRVRSGDDGLAGLTEVGLPLEASTSPAGIGRLRLLAQPTYLSSGTVGGNALNQARFGTEPLAVTPPATQGVAPGLVGPTVRNQTAAGVGLDLAYNYQWIAADVGSTPLGFLVPNVIGGIELSPQLAPGLTLRLTGERRAVTDSLLSYAGTKDQRTDTTFGGVTRSRGYAQLEATVGRANFYAGGGGGVLDGTNVESNTEAQAGLGGSAAVWQAPGQEVRAGVDLVYFGFDHNLRYFTLGQGGYFSPQTYFAALLPVSYQQKAGPLSWSVGGSVGIQTYHESSSDVFPNNPDLQSQLVTNAAFTPGLQTSYSGRNSTGFAGSLRGAVEYELSPQLKVGARASYQHAGDYDEGQGLIYARYVFNGDL